MRGVREMRRASRFRSRRAARSLGLIAVAVSLIAALLVKTRAEPAAGEETAIFAADTALSDAMRVGDRSLARRVLSLQFTFTDEGGRLFARREFLADLKNLLAAPPTDRKVTVYGLVAAVTGHRMSARASSSASSSGSSSASSSFFLDVWVKQKGAWRALAMQNVVLAEAMPAPAPPPPGEEARAGECRNPCQTMPYRVRSQAEQEVYNSFLAIEKASIAHDAQDWSKHVADEFVLYRSGYPPITKPERIAAIEQQNQAARPITVGELQAVRLSVYGDAAAMIATEMVPNNSRPPYRAARVWVRRNGQWLMAISVQTDIQTP